MSMMLDAAVKATGTRFLVFAQPRFLDPGLPPDVVTVSVPTDRIEAGPADNRMFVVDAVNKSPYSTVFRPPFTGDVRPQVAPGADGHFTHLVPGTREFSCAAMYATVRRVLDIWEDYFQHRIAWHFEASFERLELIPLIQWDNAQSGYGFLEFGFGRAEHGGLDFSRPYCENFDVLAHELGHSLVFAEVGVPVHPGDAAIDYGGMHESAGDLVAIVAVLHFDSIVRRLLDRTRGNLFTVNELARVGELAENRQIRLAFNSSRMSDVGTEPHDRSIPLTGAIFDVMVEVFQKTLVARKLITTDLSERSGQGPNASPDVAQIAADFETAYAGRADDFERALLEARDYLGRLLAAAWGRLSPNFLTYHDVLRALLRADREAHVSGGQHQRTIRECFAWREIVPGPGSILLRQHTVRECGLGLGRRSVSDA